MWCEVGILPVLSTVVTGSDCTRSPHREGWYDETLCSDWTAHTGGGPGIGGDHCAAVDAHASVCDAGLVDLAIRAMAPAHVDTDSTYVVNVSYANKGWVASPDNWVRVTLPAGTQFVTATYPGGEPRPPDEIDDGA